MVIFDGSKRSRPLGRVGAFLAQKGHFFSSFFQLFSKVGKTFGGIQYFGRRIFYFFQGRKNAFFLKSAYATPFSAYRADIWTLFSKKRKIIFSGFDPNLFFSEKDKMGFSGQIWLWSGFLARSNFSFLAETRTESSQVVFEKFDFSKMVIFNQVFDQAWAKKGYATLFGVWKRPGPGQK